MTAAPFIRVLFVALSLCAALVAWRMNALVPSREGAIAKHQIEAVINAGGGEILLPPVPFQKARANMVMFTAQGCDLPFYVLAGSLHNETQLYMLATPGIEPDTYETSVAHMGDIEPQPGALTLHFRQFMSDAKTFFGGAAVRNSRYALFFLRPRGCDIDGQFAWRVLWPSLRD